MSESNTHITLLDEPQTAVLESVLVERLYEFNSKATGHFDGRLIGGKLCSATGELIGGFSGHTWAGCCEITHLWVNSAHRGKGVGTALLRSAEAEASRRGCSRVMLFTYSFQAPDFYAAQGYERQYTVSGWPNGHSNHCYVKTLRGS